MKYADMVATAANNLPPGGPARINFEHRAEECDNKYDGASATSFLDGCRANVQQQPAATDPYTAELAAAAAKSNQFALAPVTIRIGMGGSHFARSFNNGAGSSILDYAQPGAANVNLIQPRAGGPIVDRPAYPLRPTVISFTIGGSHQIAGQPCFDRVGVFNTNLHQAGGGGVEGAIQSVPSVAITGPSRPVIISFDMGGSHFDNSWNQDGSATVLANEFLDRLTREIPPSVLASIKSIHFGMGGSNFSNSFDD